MNLRERHNIVRIKRVSNRGWLWGPRRRPLFRSSWGDGLVFSFPLYSFFLSTSLFSTLFLLVPFLLLLSLFSLFLFLCLYLFYLRGAHVEGCGSAQGVSNSYSTRIAAGEERGAYIDATNFEVRRTLGKPSSKKCKAGVDSGWGGDCCTFRGRGCVAERMSLRSRRLTPTMRAMDGCWRSRSRCMWASGSTCVGDAGQLGGAACGSASACKAMRTWRCSWPRLRSGTPQASSAFF